MADHTEQVGLDTQAAERVGKYLPHQLYHYKAITDTKRKWYTADTMADTETKHAGGRPPRFKNREEMEEVINAWVRECTERKEPLTMTGLAIALGFDSRQSLVNYSNKDEFVDTIKKARLLVEHSLEKRMLESNGVVAGIIFNAKNNFGWVDKQEVDQNTNLSGGIELKWKED